MNICTKRLVLHELRKEDAFLLYHYRCKKTVEKYQSFHSFTYQQALETVKIPAPQPLPGSYQLGIYKNGWLIGDLFFHLTKEMECFIGYSLDDEYWHQGYATEAVKASIYYLKEHFNITKYYAYIDPENSASIRLIRRLGFVKLENGIFFLHFV